MNAIKRKSMVCPKLNAMSPRIPPGVMMIDHQQLGNDAYKSLLLHKIKDNYNPAWGKADQAILNDAIGIDSISLFPETMGLQFSVCGQQSSKPSASCEISKMLRTSI